MAQKKKTDRFVMNALGECFRNDATLISSVNVSEMARDILPAGYLSEWQKFSGKRHKRLDRMVRERIALEFRLQALKLLTLEEWEVYQMTSECQDKLQSDRFRFYGHLINRRRTVTMATEFIGDKENKALWDALDKNAKEVGAKVEIMQDCDGEQGKQIEFSWEFLLSKYRFDQIEAKHREVDKATLTPWMLAGVSVV